MKTFLIILAVFAGLVVIKFLLNLTKYISARRLRTKYTKSFEPNGKFDEDIPRAKRLFEDAGLNKRPISIVTPAGYGYIQQAQVYVSDNLGSRRKDMVGAALQLFDELVGTYKMRMLECISPRYWIEWIIFLPRQIVQYLGGAPNGFFAKLLQVLYWILTPVLLLLREQIYQIIGDLIQKL